ncbi:hypothetical protein RvY_07758 [Ramazzottius varieornatus]|uniref:Secreted protein n=1 Tax=Ramazzottius varieornatus TaxID=947166 RepID=A0A1D1V3C6_RAMVA|nr:hypothetical protein RvY_07758 [Ramazzottius varieornatus]
MNTGILFTVYVLLLVFSIFTPLEAAPRGASPDAIFSRNYQGASPLIGGRQFSGKHHKGANGAQRLVENSVKSNMMSARRRNHQFPG